MERVTTPLPLSVSTLTPVALLCLASSVAAAALTAWVVGSNKDEEIGQVRQALQASQARAQVLEVLALNGMGAVQARDAVALLNAASNAASVSAGRPAAGTPPPAPAATSGMAPGLARPASPVQMSSPAATPGSAGFGTPRLSVSPYPSAPVPPTPYTPPSAPPSPPATAQDVAPGDALPPSPQANALPKAPTSVRLPVEPASPPSAALPQPAAPKAHGVPTAVPAPTDRVTLIPAQQLGVAKIEPGAVVMISGKRVRVGETFDSGEVLREADPAKNRIVTDLRTVGLL